MRYAWRVSFVAAAVFLFAGGPQHPRGTMAEMLGHPRWVPSHVLLFAGFLALLGGLVLLRRNASGAGLTAKWLSLAMLGTAIQTIEMAIHTAASVDHANLVAGRATPVLTTHLFLSVPAYPLFAISIIGLIVAGMRERSLGSAWIGWLGILGAAAHGLAAPLTILSGWEWPRLLFPMMMLLALWLVLAALWPVRAGARVAVEAAA